MITRIDGFKPFAGLSLDLPPFVLARDVRLAFSSPYPALVE